MKKIISLLLMAAVLVTGICSCGKNTDTTGNASAGIASAERDAGSGGKGRFMESEVVLPEGTAKIYTMGRMADGSVSMLTWSDSTHTYCIHNTKDMGETWNSKEIGEDIAYIAGATVRADGTIAVVTLESDESGIRSTRLLLISENAKIEKKDLIFPESDNDEYMQMVTGCAFDSAGKLLLLNLLGDILTADTENGKCDVLCDAQGTYSQYFGVSGQQIFVATKEGFLIYDSATGNPLEKDTVLDEMISADTSLAEKNNEYTVPVAFTAGMEEDAVVYANHEGVFYHTRGSGVNEQLIIGSLSLLGDSSVVLLNLLMMDEEHFLLSVIDASGENRIIKYSYDKDALSMPETELKVYALKDSMYLRQVISSFQRAHQDIYVNLQIGVSAGNGLTAEDAIKALNTDILSKNGPDVLILDGMPVDSYIEKGILMDLSALVEKIDGQDGLFPNIVEAYRKDGAIYELPARFAVNLINGTQEAVSAGGTIKQLADYSAKQFDGGAQHTLSIGNAEEFLDSFFDMDSARWMDESGKIDEDTLKDWLTQVKRIYDTNEHYNDEDVTYSDSYSNYKEKSLVGSMNAFDIMLKECDTGNGTIVSLGNLEMMTAVNEQLGMDYDLMNRDAVKTFIPYQLAGIVNGTTKQQAAEAFVEMMFGVDCQSVDGNGFPVNETAWKTICDNAKNHYDEYNVEGVAVSTDDGTQAAVELANLTDEQLAKLTSILESINSPSIMDETIRQIVVEQGKHFLDGTQSVEETVNTIMQKCNLYLSE